PGLKLPDNCTSIHRPEGRCSHRRRPALPPQIVKRGSMQFGITIKPDIAVERIVALTHAAEQAGFEYGWIFDSHVIWKEPFPLLTLMAGATREMHLGT